MAKTQSTILVAMENPRGDELRDLLADRGHFVIRSLDGPKAVHAVCTLQIDLIVVDRDLPALGVLEDHFANNSPLKMLSVDHDTPLAALFAAISIELRRR